jgi:hypothetical protein
MLLNVSIMRQHTKRKGNREGEERERRGRGREEHVFTIYFAFMTFIYNFLSKKNAEEREGNAYKLTSTFESSSSKIGFVFHTIASKCDDRLSPNCACVQCRHRVVSSTSSSSTYVEFLEVGECLLRVPLQFWCTAQWCRQWTFDAPLESTRTLLLFANTSVERERAQYNRNVNLK